MALVDGKLEEAEALLEKAWPYFGDACIDESESISVPILWADLKLRQEDSQAVVTRLDSQARMKTASPILCQFYALALQNCGEFEVARKYLIEIGSRYDKNPNFRFLLAGVMVQLEDKNAAIQVLETVVGPSCAGGSCGTGAKHPASMRMLTALLLERNGKGDLNQAGQILMHLERALSGHLSKNDLLMTARYHRLCNDEAAAELAENEAERLSDVEQDALAAAGPSIGSTGEKAVL